MSLCQSLQAVVETRLNLHFISFTGDEKEMAENITQMNYNKTFTFVKLKEWSFEFAQQDNCRFVQVVR